MYMYMFVCVGRFMQEIKFTNRILEIICMEKIKINVKNLLHSHNKIATCKNNVLFIIKY